MKVRMRRKKLVRLLEWAQDTNKHIHYTLDRARLLGVGIKTVSNRS